MKFPNLEIQALFLGLAISSSLSAFASGGSSDGGGNAVCNSLTKACKMVEEFQQPVSEIKGFKTFEQKMELLRKELPDFAARLDAAVEKKTWYKIPAEFDLLSVDQTKLRFSSNQAAYQNDSEIFVSENSLAQMDEDTAAIKIMHEALMAMQEKRDPEPVRVINGKIFASDATPLSIQQALAVNRFGVYFTPRQMKQQREAVQLSYMDHLKRLVEKADGLCNPGADHQKMMDRLYRGEKALQGKEELETLVKILNDYGAEKLMPGQAHWNSPFSDSPSYHGGMRFMWASTAYQNPALEFAPNKAADSNPKDYSPGFRKFFGNLSVYNPHPNPAEKEMMGENYNRLEKLAEEDTFLIRERLAQHPAMIDLLAVQVKLGGNESELKPDFFRNEASHQRLVPIFDRVAALLKSVPAKDPARAKARICANVAQLKPELERLTGVLKRKYLPEPLSSAPIKKKDMFDQDHGDAADADTTSAQ